MRSDRGYRDGNMRLSSMGGGLVLLLMSRLGGGFSLGGLWRRRRSHGVFARSERGGPKVAANASLETKLK